MCPVRFVDDIHDIERKKERSILLGVISRKYRLLYHQILNRSYIGEKLVAGLVLGSVILAITVSSFVLHFFLGKKNISKICVEHGCIISAARILEGMNASVSPCDDFYEYMCGNWPTRYLNRPGEANSWFAERTEVVNRNAKSVLETPYENADITPIQQMKKFYSLCADTSSLNRNGLTPVFKILDQLGLPRFLPTLDTATDLNLAEVLSHAQRLLNFDILIQLSINFNSSSNMNLLSVGPASNEVSFLSSKTTEVWKRYISKMSPEEYLVHRVSYMTAVIIEMSNGALHIDDVTREAIKIVFLEAQLKLDIDETSRDGDEKYMTLSDLQEFMFANFSTESSISTFNWQDYITVLMENLNVSFDVDSAVVQVTNPVYFQILGSYFINLKPINFQRFIWWKVVHAIITHTTDVMRMHEYMFNQYVLNGVAPQPTRSKVCVELTKTLFSEALAFKLAARQNIEDVTSKVKSMMSNIRETLRKIVMDSDWLDQVTKNITLRKLDSMKFNIGYPQHLLNPQWLVERYKKVKLVKNDFLGSLLAIRASNVEEALKKVHTSEKQNDSWFVDPTEVNAFYIRRTNSIAIPFGILQYPFYVDGIQALNYGAIGSILGHEMTHGFDNEGRDYDWNGDKKALWSERMTSMYNNRSQCFIDQYSKYHVFNNLTISGNRTLAENIADNGGIKEAFHAYEKYVRENGAEKLLPGFENFTHQQLFFMSFANVWCKQQNEVSLKLSVNDEHSPNKYRVIGSLSNLEEFSQVWNCNDHAKMNPKNKCVVW